MFLLSLPPDIPGGFALGWPVAAALYLIDFATIAITVLTYRQSTPLRPAADVDEDGNRPDYVPGGSLGQQGRLG